ncbi:MAG: hydrogenase maturation nickel metallochaperone HypA [Chloroflexi bacterium]|nr:hydrogenase maturation nickel metallochaperone HypA [Chloroflexota bacterium]
MHELAVTESILEIGLRYARQEGAARITDLYLVIGDLSSIVDDSVQFYWEMISQGTMAENSVLHFRRVTAAITCQNCNHTYSIETLSLCPGCDSSQVRITAGEEFYLEAIDVADGG